MTKTFGILAAKIAFRGGLAFISGPAGTKEASSAIDKAIEDTAKQTIQSEKIIDYLQKARNLIYEFSQKVAKDSSHKCIFFIVDELDRARPSFAIDLLEVVKHIFDVPGAIFFIATDRKMIENSARHEFGAGLDVDGYLRRLFDFWISLPEGDKYSYMRHVLKNYNLYDEKLIVDGDTFRCSRMYWSALTSASCQSNISLRSIDQLCLEANVFLRTIGQEHPHLTLLGWIQGLKISGGKQALYKYTTSLSFNELREFVTDRVNSDRNSLALAGYLICFSLNKNRYAQFENALKLESEHYLIRSIYKYKNDNYQYDFDVSDESFASVVAKKALTICNGFRV